MSRTAATPTTTHSLEADAREALADLLLRLADDELVIGHRNSEWTGLGPILEADIAFSSMAQDEIGHAQAYYRLLHDLGRPAPDAMVFARRAADFRCAALVSLPRGDWAFSIVRQFLYDAAESVRLEALAVCSYSPLAALVRKLRGEEKYHLLHGRTWLMKLGSATEDSHARMQTAVDELFPYALGLFESTPHEAALAALRIQPTEAELLEQWCRAVEPVIREAGLRVPANCKPLLGGRTGKHPAALNELVDEMQKVSRIDPSASW